MTEAETDLIAETLLMAPAHKREELFAELRACNVTAYGTVCYKLAQLRQKAQSHDNQRTSGHADASCERILDVPVGRYQPKTHA